MLDLLEEEQCLYKVKDIVVRRTLVNNRGVAWKRDMLEVYAYHFKTNVAMI